MKNPKISNNVIQRLPRYIRHLRNLESSGVTRVSSSEISRITGFTASQIRQDLNCFGGFGQQGYGYNVSTLLSRLSEVLGMDTTRTAVIIGVGNLGHALIRNFQFDKCGFQVISAFDTDPALVGSEVAGVPVHHVDTLEERLIQTPTDIVILTVPAEQANEIALRASRCGVRGVWNFTNEKISSVPDSVAVQNVYFSDSLLALGYFISENG